jgi:hypothetical protein
MKLHLPLTAIFSIRIGAVAQDAASDVCKAVKVTDH